ncbi:MAG TPA: HAMP domain-containing sensor histidine kinase [Streptosporangiaceae bacterium]|nr:HAMP domain-containing sensor histidine kinase [Streptosporangiaceae bacterium]
MTLRGRLIAGLLALLALSCALIGVVTYLTLRSYLFSQTRNELAAASKRYAACVGGPGSGQPPSGDHDNDNGPPPGPVPGCGTISGQAAGTFSARLVDYSVVNASIVNGVCDLKHADEAVLASLPVNGPPASRTLPSLHGTYLLTAVAGPDNSELVTGLPLAGLQNTLREVEAAELIVFAIALVLAGGAGLAWVRLSLRPLARMTAVAAEVTSLPLASGEVELPHRVPDADPRTEVGQLGTAFNRMLGHVESALTRREASEARLRQFAADASHELRTPLAAIRGYAEFARRDPGPVPDTVAHALSRVDAESARMSVLVDELLLLAQLDAGRPLASEPVDLTRLAIDVTSDARAAGPGHRWRLQLPDEPVFVSGDEYRLHQVLANLLANAGKHTPDGTTVTVQLAIPDAGTVQVSVTDDGPGIPADLRESLFERFVRGNVGRSRASGGSGLGLSIVAAVTAAHHGTVQLTSRPGETRFTITLPRLSGQPEQS